MSNLLIGSGLNSSRQLGVDPDAASANGSEIVELPVGLHLSSDGLISLSAGLRHTVFVYGDGRVFVAGDDRSGQLGGRDRRIYHSPAAIEKSELVVSAVCGQYYTCYLAASGALIFNGWKNPNEDLRVVLEGGKCVFLAAGFDSPVAIDEHGALYVFPADYVNQKPVKMSSECKFYDAAKGTDFVIAVDVERNVYGSGALNGGSDQLAIISGIHADHVFACYRTAAILDQGRVFLLNSENEFELVEALRDKKIVNMDVGQFYCLFVTENGELYGLGQNSYGELMTGKADQDPAPLTKGPFQRMKINFVKCGHHHSIAIVNGQPIEHQGKKIFLSK